MSRPLVRRSYSTLTLATPAVLTSRVMEDVPRRRAPWLPTCAGEEETTVLPVVVHPPVVKSLDSKPSLNRGGTSVPFLKKSQVMSVLEIALLVVVLVSFAEDHVVDYL